MATGQSEGTGGVVGALGAGIGQVPTSWDLEADVVVIGAGATGLPAAIAAVDAGASVIVDAGASVIVVEANYDIGGHAILSGGNVPLGGGTSAQQKYGIQDSAEVVFRDLTDWTVVQPNGWPDYRYNDRAVMRAFADHCAATYDFLVANGVQFKDVPPDNSGAHSTGNSAPRENHAFWTAGPIWAIFDADAAAREQWTVAPPYVDPDGYCFSATTLTELAAAIQNLYQARPMDGATLQATVERYNAFVDSGTDVDFGKPRPQYKLQKPPFYAAWATPLVHDTRAGLRINAQCQVMDMQGQVIPGLYCGGESAGGFNQHGLGRCTAQGYMAGKYAAAERP